MFRKTLSLLLLPLLWAGTTLAQTLNQPKLDSLLTSLETNHKAMGSLTLVQNGQVIYSRTTGLAQTKPTATPATAATRYRVGSVSKLITATMVMQLVEEGKLKLDAPITAWFPQLPNAARVTVQQLLMHRSGLHSFTADEAYLQYMTQPKTQAELLTIMAAAPPDFEPGAKYEYSNTNYVLLGYIVEKVTKQSYAQALQKRIVDKLKLKDTYYGSRIDAKKHEAASFKWNGTSWDAQPETDMSIPGGAGAVVSNSQDLARIMEGLFSGKLVKPATLQQMQAVQDGYGLGMMMMPFNGHKSYGHFGIIDGFRAGLTHFPAEKLTVAYTGNTPYSTNDVLLGVLSIYFSLPYRLPDFSAPALSAADLNPFVGNYASTQMPLKINVTVEGNTLMGQATGQGAFPLTPKSKTQFVFPEAGLQMDFDAAQHTFTLRQAGNTYLFKRE
ncbi:serine hydrolase domain-containing protein [Hymenobacter guriensis]|uniref:Beta-lactamase family protein n=1 Tax=Hymenobacter guriensis TaxID=2793065 RepID=A0ABS0L3B7_9BACT|nr:serine hydrolase domain-containing protein [Hymenobacter guriensis]MBG8554583.1 beta-lactamase family protein [Hymenobacter guriensis]